MKSALEKHVLQLKKNKVIEVVSRICRKRHLPFPSINFEYCSEENQYQLAHYHLYTNTICISERQLTIQNLDELEHVVAHEVSHILVQDHSSKFEEQLEISKIGAFQPSAGVVTIGRTSNLSKIQKKTKLRIDKTRCNYHLCRQKTKIQRCRYCKNFFCKNCLKAKPAGLMRFNTITPDAEEFRRLWQEPGGHPCAPYTVILEQKIIERKQREDAAFKKFLGSSRYTKSEPVRVCTPQKQSILRRIINWFR